MSRQRTIMVVDDQDIILDFIEDLLIDAGYAVQRARNGGEALERITHLRPDLVLTDFAMPGMDGWQLIQAIRALPFGHDLPIILMSAARHFPFTAADFDEWTAFVGKPFAMNDLLGQIARFLDPGNPRLM